MKCSGNYVLEITLWNFQQFFTKLGTVEAKSLQLTKQMLEKRQQLEMVIQGLQQKINTGLSKINELQQEEAILEKHELDILANKDFSYEAKIQQDEKCLEYNFTCHYPCSYPLGEDKYHCTAVVNQASVQPQYSLSTASVQLLYGLTTASVHLCQVIKHTFW